MVDRRITARIARPPDTPINLQAAVQQVIIATCGPEFVTEFSRAMLGDFTALEVEGYRRAAAWEAARSRILGWLRAGHLTLFIVSKANLQDALAVITEFWQSSDHEFIVLYGSLLDRNEDDSGKNRYVLDRAVLQTLLEMDSTTRPPPIQSRGERRAKLEKLAREIFDQSLERMPSRDRLLPWARDNVACNVNQDDIRWLRKKGPQEIRRGGAGMHRRKRRD